MCDYGREIRFTSIGVVRNEIEEPTKPDAIKAVESTIILDPALVDGLNGLEAGGRVTVLFHFDRANDYELMQHPRGDTSRPKRGLFALRTPRRPNGIGVTIVDILSIEGNVLRVRGLDAIDGTPVLDLKPPIEGEG